MHIPDGFLDPRMSVGLIGVAVLTIGYCFNKVKEAVTILVPSKALEGLAAQNFVQLLGKSKRVLSKAGEQKIYKMGMVASLVFAAQMFNFPISQGTSGHLIGGAFSVVILGPFAGVLVLAVVVMIQALFFADGGLLAIGANVINMAFFGAFIPYYLYSFLKSRISKNLSIAFASWFSVVLASIIASFEIAMSGTVDLSLVLKSMVSVHILIGFVEAFVTGFMVQMFNRMTAEGE
ncbi:hypothetical protein A2230_04035 [candidate division WOR-1 bacterium RIFOXYA2_FULL_36_21]|uniref:Cobalamin biosynthesis protein CbiM n=1 Tax=candidate division WOR-1 bacterium RIFOXYB2_FULL_36_35 TaxID=1802578 RepID=A0A1F4RZV3_UNCSA|nr:MAG: hypothetical protein A2230_04035 [candidate division WOR-1 bacterium RIFOXYA2_FULL_36_21]OGC13701.1 MAG: hypothetical protein A2290_02075 [candidate division WOR-1 bacterium RIFOXYB2_FULL_36_35]OGC16004.1 MAG: hypothetical protein A2282_05110 [candidate division WOR-1 bacterium RIFOXYA12_FULL_36_13]